MASFDLPRIGAGMSQEDLLNAVASMRKQLYWLLNNLDSLNVTAINTNITTVSSETGQTIINGNILEMYDNANVLRLKMGYDADTNSFVFTLYDSAGSETMKLNASGEAIFQGNISTSKDAYIGNNIYIGNTTTLAQKKIVFYSNSGNTVYLQMQADGDAELYTQYTLRLFGSNGAVMDGNKSFDIISQNATTEQSTILHSGSGDLVIQHDGTGNIILKPTSGNAYISDDLSPDNIIVTMGYISVALAGYATESFVTGQGYVTGTGVNASFTTADGKTVTVVDGLITSVV